MIRIEIENIQSTLPKTIIELNPGYALTSRESILETQINIVDTEKVKIKERIIHIDGVLIYFYKKNISEQQKLRVVSDSGYIQMHFELSTGATIYKSRENKGSILPTYQGQHMLFFEPYLDGYLTYPACSGATSVQIELSTEWLKKKFGEELSLLKNFGFALERSQPAVLGGRAYPICPDIYRILKQLYDCPYADDLKKFFIENKILELLAIKIHKATNALQTKPVNISKTDRERLFHLKELLSSVKTEQYTIQQMAELTFMNRTKLQDSFKQLFGMTINEFVVDKRMEYAHELLLHSPDWTVAEVAYKVGYKYYNSFSAAFKNKFGISPSKIV